jgi:uncharacterized repeat protein (TIGR02543 family)
LLQSAQKSGGNFMRKIIGICAFLFFLLALAACTGTEKVTINFNSNGGNEISEVIIDADTTTIDLPNPVKEGFQFDGWYFDEALTVPFTITGLLTNQNPTLYAKWVADEQETFTITFESNGGSAVSPINLAPGVTITAPTAPTKEGYIFKGWFTNNTLTTPYTFANMPANNLTLYAKWAEITTITFNSNGGSQVAAYNQEAGTTIIAPNAPTKEGYSFDGWYADQALATPYTFTTMPTQDITVYAKWNVQSFTITFEANGGSVVANLTADFEDIITQPIAPTKDGYSFGGWYTDQALTTSYTFTAMPAQNLTLYAKWDPIVYTMSFETNEGSAIADISLGYQETIPAVTNPTKQGYEFDGWYEDVALTILYTIDTMPLNGITLYAKWTPALVEVSIEIYLEVLELFSYDLDNTITESQLTGSTYTHVPQSILGFTYESSYPANTTVVVNADGSSTIELYYVRNEVTISYDSNSGTAVLPLTGYYEQTIVHPSDPTKVGYEFDGWYKDVELTISFDDTTLPNTDTTLYAKWSAIQSTIAFDTAGGNSLTDLLALTDQDITLPTPFKVGYTFVDWFMSNTYEVVFDKTTMPAGYTMIYAKWTPTSYSITYEEVGGSLVQDEDNFYKETIVEPEVPTKTNYIFDGWYLDDMYENAFVFDKMPAEDLILYAKWIDATDPTSIAVLINQIENTSVSISGIVYAKNAALYPGFYIYDETGYVYIDASHTTIDINDLVSLDGELAFDGNIAYITNVSNLVVDLNDQVEKVPQTLTLAEVAMLNVASQYLINDLYEAEGILVKEDDQFSLIDITIFEGTPIYGPSFLDDRISELDTLNLDRVDVTYVLVYKDGQYQISIVDIEANPLTELEKVNIIKDLIIAFAFEPYYKEGSLFELPSADPLGFVGLTYQAIGDNAVYFDMETHAFLDVEQDTIVEFEITLTSAINPLVSETFSISVLVKPIIVDTVLDLLEGQTGAYYQLDVIVISTSDMGMMMLKDDTGIVYAQYDYQLQIGDRVLINAKRQLVENQVMLSFENDGIEIIDIISRENEIGLVAQPMTIQELLALDETDPTIYGQYIEVRGYLIDGDYMYHHFTKLVDGLNEIGVEGFTYAGFEKLMEYGYLEVYLKGYITETENGLVIYYEGIRGDIQIPVYTDQELVDTIKQILIYMTENVEFEAFSEFPLYPYHPVLGADVTWELSSLTQQYFNQETQSFTYSLEDVDVEMTATIQSGSASTSYTINKVLHKIELKPISELITNSSYGEYYVKGYIAYWHPNYSYIVDENGLMILVDEHLEGVRKGDEVILYANWNNYFNGAVYLQATYNEENLIVDILSYDNEIVYTYESYDMTTLLESNMYDPSLFNQWITIQGYIVEYGDSDYYLETIDGSIKIFSPDEMTMYELALYKDQLVNLRAIINHYDKYDQYLTINYLGLAQDIELVEYTDLEKVNLTKQYILDTYSIDMYGDKSFNFYLAQDLFNGVSLTFNVLTDVNNALDINLYYINSVDEYSQAYLEVTVSYGMESETFNLTMTILPEEEVIITGIEDAILDHINVFTIRGLVVGVSDTIDNAYILLVQDTTGYIRIKVDYNMFYEYYDYGVNGYIGDILDITGTTYLDNGFYQMDAQTIQVNQRNQLVDKTFNPMTLAQIVSMNHNDASIYGHPVNIIGTIEKEDGLNAPHYYISDGVNRILISTMDLYWSQIGEYVGYQVSLNGFIFGANSIFDTQQLTILTNRYTYGETPSVKLNGYSDEEIVDFILEGVSMNFYQYPTIYQPGDTITLPGINQPFSSDYPQASLNYSVLDGSDYVDSYGYFYVTKLADEDQIIYIQAQTILNGVSKTITLEFKLNGYTYSTLNDLFVVEEGTQEIALSATVLYQGFGYFYFLIEDKVYYLESYSYDWISKGDAITIVGKKRVIDGVADYTYDVRFRVENSSFDVVLPQMISLETLYTNDYDINPYQESYLSVYGKVGYDPYLDMYTLSDQGYMVYIRTNGYGVYDLEEYMNFYIYLNAYLPLGKYVRGDYMVIDSESSFADITVAQFDSQESVDQIILLANQILGDYQITSGQALYLPSEDPYYATTIEYELVDPLDNVYIDLDNRLSNIVSTVTEIDILVTVTSQDELISEQTTITITISPLDDILIRDAYRVGYETYIQTTGVITNITLDSGEYAWIIINDGFDEIIVYLRDQEVFGYDDLAINIGDEIRVIGTLESNNDISFFIDPARVIQIITPNEGVVIASEIYSFEDIMDMDYLSLDHVLTYVNVSGLLTWDGYNYAIENDIYYVNDYEGDHYYNIGILIDSGVINLTLNNAIDTIVEVEGYILLDYLGTYFDWYICPTNITTNLPE